MPDLKQTDELTQRELTQRILRIIAETQRKDVAQVTIDSSFEELGIDSMDGINIIFALENEFNINVPDEEVKNIRSVRDVVEGVIRLIESGKPEAGETGSKVADGGAPGESAQPAS
jgi:acyl carrier protein